MIHEEALETATAAIGGFPYLMQLVGFRMWGCHPEAGVITENDARKGVELARKDMEHGVLSTTYRELSDGDVRFLRALSHCGGTARVADVAECMGVSRNYAAQYRRRLLEQGVIDEPRRGSVAFSMPLLDEYLAQHELP